MTAIVHTLVGIEIDSTKLAIQGVSYDLNPEYLKAKATATVAYDLVATTGYLPSVTAETYDLKKLNAILGSGYSKQINHASIYEGLISSSPDPGVYYKGVGSLKLTANTCLLMLNSISVDKRQPLKCEIMLRGSMLDATETTINNFSVTHSAIYTASSFEVTDGSNTLVSCGINNLTFNLNPTFYEHYETALLPDFSAVTNYDPQVSATVLISATTELMGLQSCADLKLNLVKFNECGASPTDAGNITFHNATFSVEKVDSRLGDVATAQITAFPKSISITLS